MLRRIKCRECKKIELRRPLKAELKFNVFHCDKCRRIKLIEAFPQHAKLFK